MFLRSRSTSSAHQGGEDGHQANENRAGIAASGHGGFEIEEVKNGEAFERASARDGVMAGLITGAASAGSFRDIQTTGNACAVELVREFLKCSLRDHFQSKVAGARLSVRLSGSQRTTWARNTRARRYACPEGRLRAQSGATKRRARRMPRERRRDS
jgi:hypothetical protein